VLIPPFDHRDIIIGQGTLGLELWRRAGLDIVVGIGGGGLIAGVAAAVKARRPSRAHGADHRRAGENSAAYPSSSPPGAADGRHEPTIADGIPSRARRRAVR
jgi:threonine dehydratase